MRKKKLLLNTVTALINQIITLVCGFILPRQILLFFGSDINGLVSSITQFLGFISLMDMGVGAVVQSSLYKPLANNDNYAVSCVILSAKRFFRKIAIVLILYTIVLMIVYPIGIDNSLGYICTAVLVASISISHIVQYFFGVTNQLLLNADQKSYVQICAASIGTVLNTIVSVVLIRIGASISVVKLGASLALMSRPLIMFFYVKKRYSVDTNVAYNQEPIKQKWNGLAQHVATFIVDRTDIVVLTLFSTLANISVYYVYHLVVMGLYQLFSVLITGIQSLLGDMNAKGENKKMFDSFSFLEWLTHMGVTFLFGCAGVLIVPFVQVYTYGIQDANYVAPLFAWVLTLAYACYCLRAFYNIMIKAVGHYKQTQISAIVEVILNISISIIFVTKLGLVGVAIGTLVAVFYRLCYFVSYLSRNIVCIPVFRFLKYIFIDCLIILIIVLTTSGMKLNSLTYMGWIIMAVKVCGVAIAILVFVSALFYHEELKMILLRVNQKRQRIK